MIGTLAWKWMDDDGKEHQFLIPEYLYVKLVNLRLISPQHWDQTQKYGILIKGTGSEINDRKVTLFWNQRNNTLTIPLGKSKNVAVIQSDHGYKKY